MAHLEVRELRFRDRGPYSFHINGGECVGLQGASGAGKSLLLRALTDLDPRSGTLLLGGVDADTLSGPQWRRLIGLLPAESGWWLDGVAEHFSDFATVDDGLLASLGFERSVGDWQISRLSTGERQRLAILRLLANQPGCLLLDEPTASLDHDMVTRVEHLLLTYASTHQAPLLWVSHDPAQLDRVCSQRLTMERGGRLLMEDRHER